MLRFFHSFSSSVKCVHIGGNINILPVSGLTAISHCGKVRMSSLSSRYKEYQELYEQMLYYQHQRDLQTHPHHLVNIKFLYETVSNALLTMGGNILSVTLLSFMYLSIYSSQNDFVMFAQKGWLLDRVAALLPV